MGGGSDWEVYRWGIETLRSFLPVIKRFGIADPAMLDIRAIEERFRAELVEGAVVVYPPMVGAWARLAIAEADRPL